MAPRASGDPHVGITLAMSVITVDHFAGVATLAGKALKGKERTVNPANQKPYLSLRVELKDLGVYVVIDPNRLNSPQISTTPRDFLNSLARAISALVETRHTCDKWRGLQNREIVIALPIDLWILANSTTTGDDGRTIAMALVELFPGLTIVPEIDREPVLGELAAEVKGSTRAPKPVSDPIGMLHDAIDEIAARYKDRGIVGLRVLHRGREIELQVREPAEPPWIAFINPTDSDGFATDENTLEGEGVTVFDALDAVSDKADAAEEDDGRHDEIEPEPEPEPEGDEEGEG